MSLTLQSYDNTHQTLQIWACSSQWLREFALSSWSGCMQNRPSVNTTSACTCACIARDPLLNLPRHVSTQKIICFCFVSVNVHFLSRYHFLSKAAILSPVSVFMVLCSLYPCLIFEVNKENWLKWDLNLRPLYSCIGALPTDLYLILYYVCWPSPYFVNISLGALVGSHLTHTCHVVWDHTPKLC